MGRSLRAERFEIGLVLAGAIAGVLAVLAYVIAIRPPEAALLSIDPSSGWRETVWPLRRDPWWPSKSFTCAKAACGAKLDLYLRVKVGFCDCARGIADDPELERISDFLELASRIHANSAGKKLDAIGLKGRSRPYTMVATGPEQLRRDAMLLGLNSGCDAVVATAIHDGGAPSEVEAAMVAFLARTEVLRWTRTALGL
jgi:hypothetical protein